MWIFTAMYRFLVLELLLVIVALAINPDSASVGVVPSGASMGVGIIALLSSMEKEGK